jgi:uncharacterized membrane protein YfcA
LTTETVVIVAVLFTLVAVLYSSVGHGGGSGYLATMALRGFAPEVMRPTALVLNVCVALIATAKFHSAGYFSLRLFLPFAIASIPSAFIGGTITIPGQIYRVIVGAILLYSAVHMTVRPRSISDHPTGRPVLWVALFFGTLIGLLSGLIGVGGGIFLSPLLLFMGWASLRETAAVSAAFILVNSLSGLAGQISNLSSLPPALPMWVLGVMCGGWLGATYGSRRLGTPALRIALALVLVLAGVKLILT